MPLSLSFRKKIVLATLFVSGFVFLITVLVLVYYLSSEGHEIPWVLQPFLIYHIQFMIIMGLAGVLSGLAMYYISNQALERESKKVESSANLVMRFLEPKEREIIELLNSKEGMTTQSEIAKLPGMSRLKAHRLIRRLETKGLISIHSHGKVNLIRLAEELKIRRGA